MEGIAKARAISGESPAGYGRTALSMTTHSTLTAGAIGISEVSGQDMGSPLIIVSRSTRARRGHRSAPPYGRSAGSGSARHRVVLGPSWWRFRQRGYTTISEPEELDYIW